MKEYQDKEWLRRKYWGEGLSSAQIGHLVGRNHKTILAWMIRYNIPRRTTSQAGKGRKLSVYHRRRIGEGMKGEKNHMWGRRGEKHPSWKGGVTHNNVNYVLILRPDHPKACPRGYILEHRFVMSEYLGRTLERTEIVHHINGIKDDNCKENLMLFPSQTKHLKFHRKGDFFELDKDGLIVV